MNLLQSLLVLFETGNTRTNLNWKQSGPNEQYATFSNQDETFGIFVERLNLYDFNLPSELEQFSDLNVYSVMFGSVDHSGSVNLTATNSNKKPIVTISIVRNGLFEKLNDTADIIVFAAKSEYDDPKTHASRVSLYTTLTMNYAKRGFTFKKWNDSKGTYFLLIKNSVYSQFSRSQMYLLRKQVIDEITIRDKLKRLVK